MVLLHLVCEDRVYFFINVSLTFINRKDLVIPEIIRTFALQLRKKLIAGKDETLEYSFLHVSAENVKII
jgi:hypothetical protein